MIERERKKIRLGKYLVQIFRFVEVKKVLRYFSTNKRILVHL